MESYIDMVVILDIFVGRCFTRSGVGVPADNGESELCIKLLDQEDVQRETRHSFGAGLRSVGFLTGV